MKMRRIVSLFLAVLMAVGTAACGKPAQDPGSSGGSPAASPAPDAAPAPESGVFAGVEPLATPTELKIGTLTGSMHGFGSYLVDKLGGYEKVGIKPTFVSFANGPVMVEAVVSDDWDCGAYGMGGTLAGTIGQGVINLGACSRDYHPTQIFAQNTSDIVAAGETIPEYPGLYGTADTWRGKEIFLPQGTTLHYLLVKGLEKFGLTINDVTLTHMEVSNVNTALRANQVEVGGLWQSLPYGDINDICTPVMTTSSLGIQLVSAYVANPRAIQDPVKAEAIKKWLELYLLAVEWIGESEENFDQVVQWYVEWNESEGIPTTMEEARIQWTYCGHYTLEENHEMLTTQVDTDAGKMNMFQFYNYDPLLFYMENGNYEKGSEKILLDPKFMNTSLIEELYAARK